MLLFQNGVPIVPKVLNSFLRKYMLMTYYGQQDNMQINNYINIK